MIRLLVLLSIGLLAHCIVLEDFPEAFLWDIPNRVLATIVDSVSMNREGLTLLSQLLSPAQLIDITWDGDEEWEALIAEAVQPYPELHSAFLDARLLPSVPPTGDFMIWAFTGDVQVLLASVQRHQHRLFTRGLPHSDPWNVADDAWKAISSTFVAPSFDDYLLSKLETSIEPLLFLQVWQRWVRSVMWIHQQRAQSLIMNVQTPIYSVFKGYLSNKVKHIETLEAVVEMTSNVANATERSAWLVNTVRVIRVALDKAVKYGVMQSEVNNAAQCESMCFLLSKCGTDMAPYPFKLLLTDTEFNFDHCECLNRSLWEATFRKMLRLYPSDRLPSAPLAVRFLRWQQLALLPKEEPLDFKGGIVDFASVYKFLWGNDLKNFPRVFASPMIASLEMGEEDGKETETIRTVIHDSLSLCEWFLAVMKQHSIMQHHTSNYGRFVSTKSTTITRAIYNAVLYIFTLTGRWDDAISEQIAALWFSNPPDRRSIEREYHVRVGLHAKQAVLTLAGLDSSNLKLYFTNAQELGKCIR
ncbi:hypothetical protein PSACC_02203 [Paramicrosporidium saccamoebae]|uniref:Uncharacterized protein n=1 Tax=Paramicrosporidium saccamoebae TaxID=1246581 RepID=A0A2H9TJI6_9FUNG|nr:hypothetical protein PSACC_02203 [Paramicrosporidium saccamoebae]